MLRQIFRVIRLLGLGRAVRMKRRHEQGLHYVRGYVASSCWCTLLECGLLDGIDRQGSVALDDFSREHSQESHVLHAVCEYLDGIGLLVCHEDHVSFTDAGRVLMAEPRGLIELLWAYEPCFASLPDLLAGRKKYGQDLQRRITYVGLGSGRLCEQLPYPVMRSMVLAQHAHTVLDLGCGDLAFLSGLCRLDPDIRCHGIDFSDEMVQYDQCLLSENTFNARLSVQLADMFDLPALPDSLGLIDCITACDTFHEYLPNTDLVAGLLRDLKLRFPDACFVIGEFCLQDPNWLRKHPTASLEHHIFHELSNQQIGSADTWRSVFRQAGLEILNEQVYDLIGHGYFTLK